MRPHGALWGPIGSYMGPILGPYSYSLFLFPIPIPIPYSYYLSELQVSGPVRSLVLRVDKDQRAHQGAAG